MVDFRKTLQWWTRPQIRGPVKIVVAFAGIALVYGFVDGVFALLSVKSHSAFHVTSFSHLKQAVLGIRMYATDFDDRLPPARQWMTAVTPFVKDDVWELFFSSRAGSKDSPHYDIAFRTRFSAIKTTDIDAPERQVLLFESSQDLYNQHGGFALVPNPPRRKRGNLVAFSDGHVIALSYENCHLAFVGRYPPVEPRSGATRSNKGP